VLPIDDMALDRQLRRFAAVCSFAGGYNLLDGPPLSATARLACGLKAHGGNGCGSK